MCGKTPDKSLMDMLNPVKVNFKTRPKGKEKEGYLHNINF